MTWSKRLTFVLIAMVGCAPKGSAEQAASAKAQPTGVEATAPKPEATFDLAAAASSYVTRSAAAWNARDAKKQTSLYTPDGVVGVLRSTGWDEKPPAAMEAGLDHHFAQFSEHHLGFTRVVGKGDVAIAEWVFTGTTAPGTPGRAAGKKVGYRGASVLTFARDGKVRSERVYVDMGTIAGQLGVDPAIPYRAPVPPPTAPTEIVVSAGEDTPIEAFASRWKAASAAGGEAVLALASADIVVSSQPSPEDTVGLAAYERERKASLEVFADPKATITSCIPAGDLLACEYTWTAARKKSRGAASTEKTGTVHALDVMRVADGKVVHTTVYANVAEFAVAFDLVEGDR
jgi:ketosteroid isomerase-like protein